MSFDPLLALILAAVFGAVSLAAAALLGAVAKSVGNTAAAVPARAVPFAWRALWPLIRMFEPLTAATLGPRARTRLQGTLQQAGVASFLDPARYRAAVLAAGSTCGVALWLVFSGMLAPLCGAVLGGAVVSARIRDRAQARTRALLRQLPFYIDLITMAVEAGLSLPAALAQAVDRGPAGPMRDELLRLLRDLRAGRPREEALQAMASRLQLAQVASLVAALITAHRQGASLGPILRAQAEQRRSERFLRAEKLAMEAPVKMLLPLALFIFPGTLVVLLFPVLWRLVEDGIL